jgi:hypothetical protein
MISDLWTIAINGAAAVPVNELGITSLVRTRRNLDVSQLSFTTKVQDIFAEPIADYGDSIVLFRDGVRWFSGTLMQLPAFGARTEESQRYVVADAWWRLERIIYRQPVVRRMADLVTLTGSMSTRIVLGQDAWGRKIRVNQQIANISNYALSQASGVFVVAALPTLAIPPLEEARDITCAEAIRRMLRWAPDCVGYMDYSTAPTTFWIVPRSALSTATIDAANGALVRAISDLTPRSDLKPRGVRFTFITGVVNEETGEVVPQETVDTAGVTTGEAVISSTIQLANQGQAGAEAVPTGLAADYYSSLNFTPWQGTLELKEEECSAPVRLGQKVNLSNGRTAWATMGAVVQSTSERIETGETSVDLGPPEHLSPQDFVELMRRLRANPGASDYADKMHNGTDGVADGGTTPGVDGFGGGAPDVDPGDRTGNPSAGGSPIGGIAGGGASASVDIQACVNGQNRTVRVQGVVV